jgi:hypothetical protein
MTLSNITRLGIIVVLTLSIRICSSEYVRRMEWLVSPDNDKAYMLDAIEAVNRAWAKEMKQTRRDS